MNFLGYERPGGFIGIRNHTLIIANTRPAANLGVLIHKLVRGTKVFVPTTELGREDEDRAAIARTLIGLAKNPNVGAVLVVGNNRDGSHQEFCYDAFVGEIMKSDKPVDTVFINDCGGFDNALSLGVRKARKLLIEASKVNRRPCGLGELHMALKCGFSDATSGISGNPTVGYLFDRIVEAGGTVMFSETTEVIGAEHILAKRFVNDEQREKFLAAVKRVENDAIASGKDIRQINPIPQNIAAGLSTLEEKSLGAIVKAGTSPLQSIVNFGEIPQGKGLHFMDGWMAAVVLFVGFAAAGSVLNIFQVGGGTLAKGAMMPSFDTGLVTPTLYMTGNPKAFSNAGEDFDFTASPIISEGKSIPEMGEKLIEKVCHIASGELTQGETYDLEESIDVYVRGACF